MLKIMMKFDSIFKKRDSRELFQKVQWKHGGRRWSGSTTIHDLASHIVT